MSFDSFLQIKNVSRSFADGTCALKNVSFDVNEGDFVVIAGSNGSGKSVLMSIIANLDQATSGEIILKNGRVGLVFQDADTQILGETPQEDVAFGAKNCGLKKEELKACVEKSLSLCGLLHKKDAPARLLSGGEKRRLAVAGVLAIDANLIIFDEPFANLDWLGVKQVCEILQMLKNQCKTIIVLTHELEKILALANRFIVLDKGEIRFDGTPEEGLKQDLALWNIKNPLICYNEIKDLLWL